jgi:hypothetical protein
VSTAAIVENSPSTVMDLVTKTLPSGGYQEQADKFLSRSVQTSYFFLLGLCLVFFGSLSLLIWESLRGEPKSIRIGVFSSLTSTSFFGIIGVVRYVTELSSHVGDFGEDKEKVRLDVARVLSRLQPPYRGR